MLKVVCRRFSYVLAVLGIIGAFFLAGNFGKVLVGTGLTVDFVRDWDRTVLIFICGLVGTVVVALPFFVYSEILNRLEIIQRFQIESPDEILADELAAEEERLIKAGGWRCPACSKVNASVVGTCACGQSRHSD